MVVHSSLQRVDRHEWLAAPPGALVAMGTSRAFTTFRHADGPLVSLAAIVSLIGSTTTRSGLRIRSEIDHGSYPLGVKITEEQMAKVHLKPHRFHGDWNYTIRPARRHSS